MDDGQVAMAGGILPFVLTDRGYVLTAGTAAVRPERKRLLGLGTARLVAGDAFEPSSPSVAEVRLPDGTALEVALSPAPLGIVDWIALGPALYGARMSSLAVVAMPLLSMLLAVVSIYYGGDTISNADLGRLTDEIRVMADEGRGGFRQLDAEDADPRVADIVMDTSRKAGSDR